MDGSAKGHGVLLNSLISMLGKKQQPAIIIDAGKRNVLFAHNWMARGMNPVSMHGTLIVTNDEFGDNYHKSTLNHLEYISECTFSFLPRETNGEPNNISITGEYVRLYGVDAGGRKTTIDIAGVPEENERHGILYTLISALVTALMATDDMDKKSRMQNFLNAIPFAVCWMEMDGRIIGCNYQFEDMVQDNEVGAQGRELLHAKKLRMDIDRIIFENSYIQKHMAPLPDIAILNTGQWHSVTKTYFTHADGKSVAGIIGIVEDVSAQRLGRHDGLRRNFLNNVLLRKIISDSDNITFIMQCAEGLPVLYISDNISALGFGSECVFNGFCFADYIHSGDRDAVQDAFCGQGGTDEKGELEFRIVAGKKPVRVKAEYRKVSYTYDNGTLVYGTLAVQGDNVE